MATFSEAIKGVTDPVSNALAGLVNLYGQVEQIKLQRAITQANLATASAGLPDQMMNAQAKGESITATPGGVAFSWGGLLLAGAVSAGALYLLLKK